MMIIIALIVIIIFLVLSGLHFYWALGGQYGSGAVIPTKNDNIKVMMPGSVATFIVAFGLLFFGLVVFLNAFETDFKPSLELDIVHKYGQWAIALIFIVRAIGDFNYVGFFKKYKQTKFGQNDTKYYSPLCLAIGILILILELNK
jgi:glucan phosphoethanolaminetransferase (alkaline phosphatase superfamily)